MVRDNILKTKYGDIFVVREYENGKIVFTLNEEESIILKKYDDESLKKFKRMYDDLNELMERFKNPTVGDVTMSRFELLIQKTEKALKIYERIVPEDFRKKFNFDKSKLEEITSSLYKEFFGNGSERGKIVKKSPGCYLKKR
jgi:hypothetical protein